MSTDQLMAKMSHLGRLHTRRRAISFGLCCAVSIATASCSFPSSPDDVTTVRVGHHSYALPTDTLEDWVTYCDFVTTFVATGERRRDDADIRRGEGLIRRIVTGQLGDPIWIRSALTHPVPKEAALASGGWVFHGEILEPIVFEGELDLSVGHTYLASFTYTNLGDPNFGPAYVHVFVLPFDLGIVGDQPNSNLAELPAYLVLKGSSQQQVARILAETATDPKAVPFMALDSVERYQRVLGAK